MNTDNSIPGQIYLDGVHSAAAPAPRFHAKTFESDSDGFYPGQFPEHVSMLKDPVIEPIDQTAVQWHKDVDHVAALCGVAVIQLGGGELPRSVSTTALPHTAAARKALPIFSGFIRYFPDAMAAVAELSRIGNEQHNPGAPLHWDRSKSGDELDALSRHLIDAGEVDSDGVLHSTKVAWRAMANLQKELERGK